MSFNKAMATRRREKDIFKLRSADYEVTSTEQASTFNIQFKGPKQTAYQQGKWTINLYLPEEYPFKSPSVGFLNKIYHPNIDFTSGSVCLDVINQTWTPMYELVNIFEIFLPQLLTYPNPASPLNHQAAQLYERSPSQYAEKVKECIMKYSLSQEFKQKAISPIQAEKPKQAEKQVEESDEKDVQSMMEEGSCSLSQNDGEEKDLQLENY